MPKWFLERELVRHAYDTVVERCARLNSFSGNLVKDLESEDIIAREKSLAIDDLITLSISARRLIAVCRLSSNNEGLRIRKWHFRLTDSEVCPIPMHDYVSLQKLFGIVIHCEVLEIIDSDLMARVYLDRRDGPEVLSLYSAKILQNKYFSPKILIKSDKSDPSIFDTAEIIHCIDRNLLPVVVEISRKHGLELESDFYI